MTIDIVIRTYDKDLPWLAYALKSIHRNVTGYRSIIIAIPNEQVGMLGHLTQEKAVGVQDLKDGYLGQQLTKMQAWKLTDADAIVFWDSDVVATRPIDVRMEYFKDGDIIVYKTRYTYINGTAHPPACPWQPITAKALGFTPEWEYMRRMPLVYWRETLEDCERFMVDRHEQSLEGYVQAQPHRSLSEFNILGAFAELAGDGDRYAFIDTESADMPPCAVDQMWSWGGITEEVRAKLTSYGLG